MNLINVRLKEYIMSEWINGESGIQKIQTPTIGLSLCIFQRLTLSHAWNS